MMMTVRRAQFADALQRIGVPDMAAERVATIGRIRDYAAIAQYLRGLTNQPRLRVLRMQFEILAQAANIRGRTRSAVLEVLGRSIAD